MNDRTTSLASLIVAVTGVLWGFYWLPVRRLETLGMPGAWGTLGIVTAAMLLLLPFAWRDRAAIRGAAAAALGSILLGGAAFTLYSVAFVYGRVAIVILLFFLTPVWSVLLARFVMDWPVPRLRLVAIVVGLAGLAVMLGGGGQGVPVPRGIGEWLALASGLLWSASTTGIRSQPVLRAGTAAFLFALGASTCALALALWLAPVPPLPSAAALTTAVGAGALWWGLSMAGLMWATGRLDPARVGILLMAEVLVGALSAALLAGETLGPFELAGGALVLAAAVLELWPVHRPEGPDSPAATGKPEPSSTGAPE
ncbi:DMT family transporter [Maribius pontilimi]|uniref:DMT family transporter n=1 Tax=Palleronia pontilimi TaxID=1964209 RepID=A0A934IHW5_9RHOB|nr:DMT family transporter [Palleronia pontilimi]MBJ3763228.1 DMT family transporter [Palleronia pontilimi]